MEKRNGQILLTGATGFIGGAVLNQLIEQGFAPENILCTTRRNTQTTDARVSWQTLDICEPILLEHRPGYVIHCAGVIDREEQQIARANIEGTRNIAEYAWRAGATLIHLSSVGVVGRTTQQRIDEHTAGVPQNSYENSKQAAEKIVCEYVEKGLKARILRPSIVFGSGRVPAKDSFLQLCQAILRRRYLHIGNGIYNLVHVDDVATALIALTDEKIASGEVYQVNFPLRFRRLAEIVCQFQGTSATIPTVPRIMGYCLAGFANVFFPLLNRPNPLTFARVAALTNTRVYGMEKILTGTTAVFSKTIEERVWETLCDYKARGEFDGVKFF